MPNIHGSPITKNVAGPRIERPIFWCRGHHPNWLATEAHMKLLLVGLNIFWSRIRGKNQDSCSFAHSSFPEDLRSMSLALSLAFSVFLSVCLSVSLPLSLSLCLARSIFMWTTLLYSKRRYLTHYGNEMFRRNIDAWGWALFSAVCQSIHLCL